MGGVHNLNRYLREYGMASVTCEEGPSTLAAPPVSFSAAAPSFVRPSNEALEVGSNICDSWTGHHHQAQERRRPAGRQRSWSAVLRESGVIFAAKVVWASTWSVWGMAVGILGLLTGGGVRRRGPILEFWGGMLPLFLKYFPFIAGSPVATFGHVVVGRSERYLDACRPHQLVHVKQYERWGPLFVPTYLTLGLAMWCCGKRPYYDNPFEREAFQQSW
jgi:hypothetical protein